MLCSAAPRFQQRPLNRAQKRNAALDRPSNEQSYLKCIWGSMFKKNCILISALFKTATFSVFKPTGQVQFVLSFFKLLTANIPADQATRLKVSLIVSTFSAYLAKHFPLKNDHYRLAPCPCKPQQM